MQDFGKFVYLELHKTGSTYVSSFLRECSLLDEIEFKKHVPIRETYNKDKFYFISIRNPLNLYSSLYRYGSSGRGGIYNNIKKANKTSCYESIESFVEFMINPKNAIYIHSTYDSRAAEQMGIMSYRFLRLSLQYPKEKIETCLENKSNLLDLENDFITNLEIKNEYLNDELKTFSSELFPKFFDQNKVNIFLNKVKNKNKSKVNSSSAMDEKLLKLKDKLKSKEMLLFSRYKD